MGAAQLWPVLAIAACVAGLLFLRKARDRELATAKGSPQPKEGSARKKQRESPGGSAQSFLGFQDIREGIIILPGGRYRAVLEVIGTVNFPLLSATEQDNIETSFRTLLGSVNFPVQFYVQTRQIDLTPQVRGIEERMAVLPAELRQYARDLTQYLTAWARYSPLTRKNYIVVQYDAGPGEDKFVLAKQELLRRCEVIGSELSKWLKWRRLTTDDIVELLYVILNKERSAYAKAQDAVEQGFLAPYVSG